MYSPIKWGNSFFKTKSLAEPGGLICPSGFFILGVMNGNPEQTDWK